MTASAPRGYSRAPLAVAGPSRVEVLRDGLGAAAELIRGYEGTVRDLGCIVVLAAGWLEQRHEGRREQLAELALRLAEATRDAAAWERAARAAHAHAQALADRAAEAEVRLELVRELLPRLRGATSRRELAALADEIEREIGAT